VATGHDPGSAVDVENRLREVREARGIGQGDLAKRAHISRQAVHAIESGRYLPTTAVALNLGAALHCRVEDLFSLGGAGEVLTGRWTTLGMGISAAAQGTRVKVARVGPRFVVSPVALLGEVLAYTVPADGLLVGPPRSRGRKTKAADVQVRLLRERRAVEGEISVAGCDPAIVLAGEYLRRREATVSIVGWTLGSAAALEAMRRGDVHVAGVHVLDERTGESNLPYLRRHLKGGGFTIVTFARWEQGVMVARGNPKRIRDVGDLGRKDVTLVNREQGSGARLLLDRRLHAAGIAPPRVQGYRRTARSHLEVAGLIAGGQADAGIGVRSAATLYGLHFLPLQEERYDLVIPSAYLSDHPGLSLFLDAIASRSFRRELEALGGYDTRETGKVQVL